MSFLNYIKDGISIVGLNKKVMKRISNDKKATNTGIIILLIAGLLSVIGMYNTPEYYKVLVMAPLLTVVFFIAGVGLLQIFVRLFGGATRYVQMFRVLSHAAVMCWLWLFLGVPVIGDVLNWAVIIWGAVITVIGVETISNMKRARAILTVLVPLVIAIIVVFIVAMLAGINTGIA